MTPTKVPLWPGPQKEFYRQVTGNKTAKRFLFIGGAQSGKTEAGRWSFTALVLARIASKQPGRAWIVAPDYILADRSKRAFEATIPQEYVVRAYGREGHFTWRLVNEVFVELRTASQPQQLRADDLFAVWFDEMSRACEDAYRNVTTRLVRWDGPLIVTTTPCIAESPWLNDEYDRCRDDAGYVWINSRIEDNRAIPRKAIAELRRRFPDQYGQEELDGLFVRSREGLVYGPVWDPKVHIVESYEPTEDDEIIVGADAGYNHPWAYLRIALHDGGGATVFDELGGSGYAPSEMAELAAKDEKIEGRISRRWFDPSAALVRAEFAKAGLPTRKAKNDQDDGIRCVYAMLKARKQNGEPTLRVVRKCHGLIREMGLYRNKRGTEHAASSGVEKINDDYCFPAETMIDTPSGRVPILDIKAGDNVCTHMGVGVAEVGCTRTGMRPVTRFTFSDGTDILCTEEHPFLLENGTWKTARSIRAGDRLLQRLSTTKDSGSTSESLATTNRPGRTTQSTRTSENCIRSSGTRSRVSDQKAGTSTTRTESGQTTGSRILNSSMAAITGASMIESIPKCGRRCLPSPLNGTVRPRGERGMSPTGWSAGRIGSPSFAPVIGAGSNTKHSTSGTLDSVPTTVGRRSAAHPASMTNTAFARCAARRIASIATRRLLPVAVPVRPVTVGRIERNVATVPVYNISTSDGTYVAGGVFVSNCDGLRYALFSEGRGFGVTGFFTREKVSCGDSDSKQPHIRPSDDGRSLVFVNTGLKNGEPKEEPWDRSARDWFN